jgi:hypothetical protein
MNDKDISFLLNKQGFKKKARRMESAARRLCEGIAEYIDIVISNQSAAADQ